MTDLVGRDLDRAVAEAKGWTEVAVPEALGHIVYATGGDCITWRTLPHYSTDWAAAGPLLEEMAAAAIEPEVIHSGHDWLVSTHPYDESPAVCGHAVGLPEAIARAYVEWKAATAGTATAASPARP